MNQISYQLYSSREFPPLIDTLRLLKSVGYTQVEAYSGLFPEIHTLQEGLAETGLSLPSTHVGLDQLENDAGNVLSVARQLGIQHIYCPHIGEEERPGSAEGWREFGARLERAGMPYRDAGLRFGWHNHDFEFKPLSDGSIPMRHILEGGPSLVWEADIAWIVRGGADPVGWIGDYASRIEAVHVKDIAPVGENEEEDGWADVGHGTMDWSGLLGALKQSNAEIYVMEHDNPNDHERFARRSIEWYRNNQEHS